jgi:SWI/SNF-related matrix-associated actin-dependent regulator 1 of chromatin subfamily A
LVAGLAKVDAATDFVLDTVESAGKVLVFAHHHDVVDAYTSRLEEAGIKLVRVTGQENAAERQQAIDAFQDGDAQVALLSIGAGGAGLNLQAATNVIFVELPWRPGDVDQAEARAWRMGQKNAITTYFLVGLQTIEEKIAKVIDTKREVVNALMGETDRTVDEDGILDAILCEILGAA